MMRALNRSPQRVITTLQHALNDLRDIVRQRELSSLSILSESLRGPE